MSTTRPPHQTIVINIAGIVVSLAADSATLAGRIATRYGDFLDPAGEPQIALTLTSATDAPYIQPEPGPWVIETSFEGDRLRYRSYLEQGVVDFERGRGTIVLAANANVENVLRAIYAWLCLRQGGLLLHAAGVIRAGRGYIFFGPSGAGKTTVARLAALNAEVVSDDLVIVRADAAGYRLHGVPFRGTLSDAPRANQAAPLAGLYRLRQDTAHFVKEMRPTEAIADLAAAAPFVIREQALGGQLIGVAAKLAAKVPVMELHFKRDDGFWTVIDEHLAHVPTAAPSDGGPGY